MKKIISLFGMFLAVGAVIVALQGCKGDQGPAGPPGDTTFLQLDGFADGIKCGDCHNVDTDTVYYVWAKKYQWELSKHFYGGDFERNSSSCAGCHTTEGYVQRIRAGNPAISSSGTWSEVTSHFDATPPGCFACHSPHSAASFALRTSAPVNQLSPLAGVANQVFDYGKGNQCVSCHQPRSLNPQMPSAPAATDTLTITSSRWYPHYGVQGLMLMGQGGFKFPGYTYTGNSPHTSASLLQQEGCVACHMAPSNAGSGFGGGHTMNINYSNLYGSPAWNTNGCLVSGCHSSMASVEDYVSVSAGLTGGVGVNKYVHDYLDTLKVLLEGKGYLNPSSGLVNASSSTPLKIPALKAGALYNFFFIEHDLSAGAHNSKYAVELLQSSIAEMKKP